MKWFIEDDPELENYNGVGSQMFRCNTTGKVFIRPIVGKYRKTRRGVVLTIINHIWKLFTHLSHEINSNSDHTTWLIAEALEHVINLDQDPDTGRAIIRPVFNKYKNARENVAKKILDGNLEMFSYLRKDRPIRLIAEALENVLELELNPPCGCTGSASH